MKYKYKGGTEQSEDDKKLNVEKTLYEPEYKLVADKRYYRINKDTYC